MLDYPPGNPDPTFKMLMTYVGDHVGSASLLLDKNTKDGDLLPVIFIDQYGRQSELTYVPVHGPNTIKETFIQPTDEDAVSVDSNSSHASRDKSNHSRILESSHNSNVVVNDLKHVKPATHSKNNSSHHTSSNTSDGTSNGTSNGTSHGTSKHTSKNSSHHTSRNSSHHTSRNSSHHTSRNSSHHTSRNSSHHTSRNSSHSKSSKSSSDKSGSQSTHTEFTEIEGASIQTEHDIDEDSILLNFTRSRMNFGIFDKELENKFVKRLKIRYDETVGGDTVSKLSDYTNIISFEVFPEEVDFAKFDVEKPEGDIIHVRDDKLEVVYAKIVNENPKDPSENSDNQSEAAEESEHNDFDFFLSLENSKGAKQDKTMFFMINRNNELAYEEEWEITDELQDNIEKFLESEEVESAALRVVFIDSENRLMSDPMFATVVNHVTTEEKFDSIDESQVKLTFKNYQAFDPSPFLDETESILDEYTKIEDVSLDQSLPMSQEAGDPPSGMEVLELFGSNTVLKIYIEKSRLLKSRLLIV
jgi:hypothetical protein